jgi:RNA polymerase sigma factor (sigma-70 family)
MAPPENLDLQQVEDLLSQVRSAEAGDMTALHELIEICLEHFRVVARRLLNARFGDLRKRGWVTDEVVNDAMLLNVYEKLQTDLENLERNIYADARSFLGAVAKRMEYVLLNAVRGRGKGGRPARQDTNAPNADGYQPSEVEPGPKGDTVRREVKDALGQLDEEDQDIIRMCYLDLMTRKEIAESFDLGERQVSRRLERAKEHFRRVYTP